MSRWLKGAPFEQIVNSKEFQRLYQDIRSRCPVLEAFPQPEDVLACFRKRLPASRQVKYGPLKALIREYQLRPNPLLSEFLAASFLPGVVNAYRWFQRRHPEIAASVLTSQVWLSFFASLKAFDLEEHCSRTDGRLIGMTRNSLRGWLRARRRQRDIEKRVSRLTVDLRLHAAARGTRQGSRDAVEVNIWEILDTYLGASTERQCDSETGEAAEHLVNCLVGRGILKGAEGRILCASTFAGRRLSAVVSTDEYQKTKKMRQRALARLKKLRSEQPDFFKNVLRQDVPFEACRT